jgi:hypothetical protein
VRRTSILVAVTATAALCAAPGIAGAGGEAKRPLFGHSCSGTCGAIQVGEVHGVAGPNGSTKLRVPPRSVYLAPDAASTQRIELEYRVYGWNRADGHYRLYSKRPGYRSPPLGRGEYWIDRQHAFPVPTQRFHTVDLVIRWRTAAGRLIGRRVIGFDHRRDYVCGGGGPCAIDLVGGDGAIYNASG